MMKRIGALGLLLTAGFWLCSAVILKRFPLINLELGISQAIVNTGKQPIRLYSEQGEDTVAWLGVKEKLIYVYSGQSGYWHYGQYQGRVVSIRDPNVRIGFWIQGYLIPERSVVKAYHYLPYLMLFCMMLLIVKKHKKDIRSQTVGMEWSACAQNRINQLEQQLKDQDCQLAQLREQQRQQQLEKKAELDAMLLQLSEEESRRRDKDVKISDLQDSYNRLNEVFNAVVDEAKLFGFPYRNKRYESILKGRKYELHVARSLHAQEYTFLEWTPDKGFEEGIYVKSNNNPDLVVAKNGCTIAIECKYRSTYFMIERVKVHHDEITWASTYSAEFYAEFSQKRDIPVFLALGFGGNPESPDNKYLIPLDMALNLSSDRAFDIYVGQEIKTKRQKIFRESEITLFLNPNYEVKSCLCDEG